MRRRGPLNPPGLLTIVGLLLTTTLSAVEVPYRLAERGHQQVTVSTPAPGVVEIVTTGNDPFVVTTTSTPADLAATPVLAFDYLCVTGLDHLEVFSQPASAERRVGVPTLPAREGWSPFAIDLSTTRAIVAARPGAWRIDLGSQPGKVIQMRNLRLRARTAEELALAVTAAAKQAQDRAWDEALKRYLATDHHAALARITADDRLLTISGSLDGTLTDTADLAVAEWPIWQPVQDRMHFATVWGLEHSPPARGFALTVPRYAADGSDRALSRFVLIQRRGGQDRLLSHGRWVDDIPAATTLPPARQRSKKGLGGFTTGARPVSDLDVLGIGSVTVNVTLSSFFQAGPGDGAQAVNAGGRTWYVRKDAFRRLDAAMLEAAKRDIVVLGIILVPPARQWEAKELGALMQHPDYDSAGIFTMPNLTSAASTAAYTVALDLLARRYSRADGRYGRVHHWIMHNEVDMGWVWTNCGRRPELVFFDQYYRSMRLAHAILRRQDPNAQVFISLTHHWAETGDPATCFPSRNLLDHLLALSRAEGDFEWGLAHHPYPASLLEAKTWLDQGAEFRLDTPKITFRNIEVLDAWVRQPAAMFHGTTLRRIHLSEQGPNSPDYSEKSLSEQAAAMAYVWKKIARLDTIHGFEYHNWVDNRHEGGLRIGLRRFPDDPERPMGTKPVWDVYRALGTPEEERACAFALPVIGLTDWEAVIHRGAIPATR